jgi:hypothetical protein
MKDRAASDGPQCWTFLYSTHSSPSICIYLLSFTSDIKLGGWAQLKLQDAQRSGSSQLYISTIFGLIDQSQICDLAIF